MGTYARRLREAADYKGFMMRLLLVLVLFVAPAVQAQGWPSKPLRMVVAFAPGGSTDVAVRSLAELIVLAKGKPGLAYATSGSGSIQHMAGEWFARLAGVQLTYVPYKGDGQAITDLLGGQVPLG
jgi:tripartite-type tricarboxylate transporter receptor subunit TctC